MSIMKIYKAEKDLGLDFIAEASWNCVSIASSLESFNDKLAETKAPVIYPNPHIEISHDLLQVNAILVSTNWNRNDDVFSPDEVWKAKSTPVYKPANVDHEGKETSKKNQIIGVIAECRPVDDDYNYISSIEKDDDEAEKFHLMVTILLWHKYFPTVIDKIKKKIDDNTEYVSMECIFPDFGYALRRVDEPDGDIHLLPRNEITAGLTQYLRAAKGPGIVNLNGVEYRIGRWLRNYIFSGVGFVEKPGNPESIIFNDYFSAAGNFYNIEEAAINRFEFDKSSENCVLSFNTGKVILWPNQ